MNFRSEARSLVARIPLRRVAVVGLFLTWTLLSVVMGTAPPGSPGGWPPD